MPPSTSLHHFTWAPSADDVRIRLFEISSRRAGFATHIIKCASIVDKPATLAREIASLDENAVICCTDSFDVLCVSTPDVVESAFSKAGVSIVFGAERVPYHHFRTSVKSFDSRPARTPYSYLNAGMITGYAGAIREMLNEMMTWTFPADGTSLLWKKGEHFNDQTLFGHYAALHPDKVALDRDARICWTIADEWDSFIESLKNADDPFINPATGLRPAFLHISHLRKYYPAYLWAARRLGLPINGSTVNLRLYDQHVRGVVEGVDGRSIAPDPETAAIINKTIEYRAMKLIDKTKERLKRARFDFGRRRREIFHRKTI